MGEKIRWYPVGNAYKINSTIGIETNILFNLILAQKGQYFTVYMGVNPVNKWFVVYFVFC